VELERVAAAGMARRRRQVAGAAFRRITLVADGEHGWAQPHRCARAGYRTTIKDDGRAS